MLLLLPPSEGKAEPARRGRPTDLAELSFPALTPTRARILEALIGTSALPDAVDRLQAGPTLAAEVERNRRLASLPARPMLEIYRGVLFDALDAPTLSPAARRRAASRLVVVSGLWGVLRPRDRIPPYRMHICSRLAGLGGLERLWRGVLPDVLAEAAGARGLVVDLRSSSYLAMGAPAGLADRTVTVRVVRETATGRSVVSHMAKHTRGLVARHLLEAGVDHRSPGELTHTLAERWPTELHEPSHPGRPWNVEIVTPG